MVWIKKVILQVLNLTPYDFSNDTIYLFKKGLSFTPAPPPNEAQLRQESSEFTRKLRLKEYFVDKNNEFIPNDIVRPKSDFTPKSGCVPELDDISSEIETMEINEKRFEIIYLIQNEKLLTNYAKMMI